MKTDIKQLQDNLLISFSNLPSLSTALKKLLAKRVSSYFHSVLQASATEADQDPLPETLDAQGFTWNSSSHNMKMSLRKFTISGVKLIQQSIYFSFLLFRKKRMARNSQSKVNVVFGLSDTQIWRNGSLSDLHSFLEQDRFGLSGTKNQYIVQCENQFFSGATYKNLYVTGNLYAFLASNLLNPINKLSLLSKAIRRLIEIFVLSMKFPFTVLVGFSHSFEEPLIEYLLENDCINAIITTPSQLICQPLMFEIRSKVGTPKKIMLWYAANAVPLQYADSTAETLNSSIYQCSSIDEHWVWSEYHAEFLRAASGLPCIIKGSMLFYPRPSPIIMKPESVRLITVFDVTPFENQSDSATLYTSKHMSKFILDIILAVNEIERELGQELSLCIKQKRNYSSQHSAEYINLLKSLSSKGELVLIESDQNIYTLVQKSNVVICAPLTSPALISREEETPVCYFSTLETLNLPSKIDEIQFIRSVGDLKDFLWEHLAEFKTRND